MSSLSDKELAQAAAEAGISPGELKEALARRESGEVVEKEAKPAKTHGFVQARFATSPSQALARAHRVFNQQVEHEPTRNEEGQISYVNKKLGVAYRLSSESDGTPMGALVRVDIDVSERMQKMRRGMIPGLAIGAALTYFSGFFSTSSFFVIFGAMFLTMFLDKRKFLKFTKKMAQEALDRANQAALPGRE